MAVLFRARHGAMTIQGTKGRIRAPVLLLALLACSLSVAQDRKVYKYLDENGKAVYSQVPPASAAKGVTTITTEPAYRGRGGYSPPVSPLDNPQNYSRDEQRYRAASALRQRQEQAEQARNKHLADLKAECNAQRQVDCNDPATLRYIESTRMPRGYRR